MEKKLLYNSTHSSLEVVEWLGSHPSRSPLIDGTPATH